MAKNRRLLINNLGESHEAFALDGSSASENKFIWRQNVKKIEKLQLKEERQVHKANALKSRYSKIDFVEWKRYVLKAKRKIAKADLKVREMLYGKGVITLSTYVGEIQEEYSNKIFEKKQKKYIEDTNKLVKELEGVQRIVTEARFFKHKDIPETISKQELIKNSRYLVLEIEEKLSIVINTFVTGSIYDADEKSIDFKGTNQKDIYLGILKEYKKIRPEFVNEARKKAKLFIVHSKVGNPLFDFHAKVHKNVFKLELAKLELDFLKQLSEYNWEYKFRLELANEYISTLPNVISTKQKTSRDLLDAKNQLIDLKVFRSSNKKALSVDAKEKIKELKKKTKLKIKEEFAKLKISKITKDEFVIEKSKIKNHLQAELKTIKLNNKAFAIKEKLKEARKNAKLKIKEESAKLKTSKITKDEFVIEKSKIKNHLQAELKTIKLNNKAFAIKEKLKEARKNAKLKIKEESAKLKTSKITKDEFVIEKSKIKNHLQAELKTIKLNNKAFAIKEKLKEARKNAKLKIKEESAKLKTSKITKDEFVIEKSKIKNHLQAELKTIKLNNKAFAIKEKLKETRKNAKLKIKEESAKLKMSGAARGGLKIKKAEIKHNLKTKVRKIKLEDEIFAAKAEYRFLLSNLSQKIKYENKILESNLQEIRKKTPVEITKSKYWSSIIVGSIFPGLGSLINGQWVKGIMQTIGTIFFIVILAWCFGAFPSSSGNGIIGLGTFGAVNGDLVNNNDSRFYLVMGTVGIIFLLAALMYWIISALNLINVANLSRAGVRYSNWKDQKKLLKTAGLPYLLSAPALIFILFIVVLPLLATLLLSFTNFNQRVIDPNNPGKHIILNGVRYPFYWVGGQQFTYITKVVGSDFVSVLEWTILWTIFATFLTIFLGTLLAILVSQNRIKGKTFFRIIYILPWAIPAFLTILFFSIFFGKDGTFNHVIGEKMFGRAINWKIEVNHEKALLIFIQGWLGQSYMFLLVTGMLQSIPKSLYEAARVDGSKPLQQFRTITMPIIVMQIAPLLIGQFTFNFNNFGIIYLFNNGGPVLPGHSAGETDIFLSWVFRMVNDGVFAKPGAGAALSLLVSIFVVTPSAFLFFRSKSFRGGNF